MFDKEGQSKCILPPEAKDNNSTMEDSNSYASNKRCGRVVGVRQLACYSCEDELVYKDGSSGGDGVSAIAWPPKRSYWPI